MDYNTRINNKNLVFSDEISNYLDNIDNTNAKDIIDALETSVSNGWVGTASELSDTLLNSIVIQNNPEWIINIHLERMKKYQYFKLINLAEKTSVEVLELLKRPGYKSIANFDLWKFTAIAQLGWTETDVKKLKKIINEAEEICNNSKNHKVVLKAFLTGLKGKLCFMLGEIEEGKRHFEDSINNLSVDEHFRVFAHLKVYYAEILFEYLPNDSLGVVTEISNKSEADKFKSHLMLRVYILLIKLDKSKKEEKEKHILSLQVLMYAMGLSQSQKIYPLINEAFKLIPEKNKIDFYEINFKNWLDDTIKKLEWQQYEDLLEQYYLDMGYKPVIKLPFNFPAFDILAFDNYRGKEITTLIQAKHYNTTVTVENIKHYTVFENAIKDLIQNYDVVNPEHIHYFVLNGMAKQAQEILKTNLRPIVPPNNIKIIEKNDEIINFYLGNPDKLIKLCVFLNRMKSYKNN